MDHQYLEILNNQITVKTDPYAQNLNPFRIHVIIKNFPKPIFFPLRERHLEIWKLSHSVPNIFGRGRHYPGRKKKETARKIGTNLENKPENAKNLINF